MAEGKIQILNEPILVIAGYAALEIGGVAELSSSVTGELVGKLGRKNSGQGVKVKRHENGISLELYLVLDYGVCIPEVALEVQRSVKAAVEKLTGVPVVEVDISVQGISYPKQTKESS